MVSDSATQNGKWRVNRTLLVVAAVVILSSVISVFPLRLVPAFLHVDSLLHLSTGLSLTFILAAIIPKRDDVLAVVVAGIGIVWEPIEWAWLECIRMDICTQTSLIGWMLKEDTLLDMSLVAFGAVLALLLIGRYQ